MKTSPEVLRPWSNWSSLRSLRFPGRRTLMIITVIHKICNMTTYTYIAEVNKRGRPSKWPPDHLPSKFADFECAFWLPKSPFWKDFLGQILAAPFSPRRLCLLPNTSHFVLPIIFCGAKWTKLDLLRLKWTKMCYFGPFWSPECQKSSSQRAQRSTKIWSRSKISISIEIFDLARKFQSRRLEFPTKKEGRGGWLARKFHSRSKFSISLEISIFFDLWALWVRNKVILTKIVAVIISAAATPCWHP